MESGPYSVSPHPGECFQQGAVGPGLAEIFQRCLVGGAAVISAALNPLALALRFRGSGLLVVALLGGGAVATGQEPQREPELWRLYRQSLAKAKYVDLTHTVSPSIPVWPGFGRSKFSPVADLKTGRPYSYREDGFEATHYDLSTDQLARSSIHRHTGIPTSRRSTSCRPPSPSARWW